MDLVTLKIICLFTRIVIFRIDLALQYIFDKFLSLSLRWLQKILGPGLMVVGMESYKCLAPPMEPLDQVDKIVQIVTKSQDHQLVCANSTTWAHLPMSGWRTHPQFCLPGQRWLPWPSPALKHIPGPNQCQCWRKRLASTKMHFRKRPVIRHRTPCWCPSKMPLISPLHIRWASSYQSLSQLRLTKNISRCTAAVSTVSPPSTTTLNCPQSPSLCQTSHTTFRFFVEINLFVVAIEIYLVWMQLCRDLRKLWLWRSPIPRPLSHLQITGWPFSRELGHLILPHSSSKVQPQRGSILISSKSWKGPKLNHSEIFSSVEAYGRTQTLFAREARSTQYRNSLEEYSKWEILEAYKIWEGVDLPPPAARCLLAPPLLLPQRHRHLAGRSQLRRPPRLQCWGGDI